MDEVPGPHREHNPPQMATVGQVSNDSQKRDFLHTANMVSLPACLPGLTARPPQRCEGCAQRTSE